MSLMLLRHIGVVDMKLANGKGNPLHKVGTKDFKPPESC